MNKPVTYVEMPKDCSAASAAASESNNSDGGYVKGVLTYMVMDDLSVKPMSIISSIALLRKFSVTDLNHVEEKVVEFGMNEGVALLKAALQSKTVLTDVFLGRNKRAHQ